MTIGMTAEGGERDDDVYLKQISPDDFCKGPNNKYFSLVSHVVSVKTTQLSHCSPKSARLHTSK